MGARLLWAAAALRAAVGAGVPPIEQPEIDATIAVARDALGDAGFAAAWDEGAALSVEDAVAVALAEPVGEAGPRR